MGNALFILTAGHLVEEAKPKDILIAPLPSEGLKYDISQAKVIQTLNMGNKVPRIQRCDWEDLALLTFRHIL